MRHGEIWWADHPPGQRHPVLLLSWDAHGDWRTQVTVAGITTRVRGLDAEVRLDTTDHMPQTCVVNLDTIATVPRSVLHSRITRLTPARRTTRASRWLAVQT